MKTCRTCNEPVIFVLIKGWTHMTIQEFDHEPEVSR